MLNKKLGKLWKPICHQIQPRVSVVLHQDRTYCSAYENIEHDDNGEKFLPLELYAAKKERWNRKVGMSHSGPSRSKSMNPDQDWPSVWPAARTFHPDTVPLPVRMGYPINGAPTPDKWANAELMKIANFLHLTPPAVKRHSAAIRKFCSSWPAGVSYPDSITATSTSGPDANRVPQHLKKRTVTSKQSLALSEPMPEDRHTDPGNFTMIKSKSTYLYSGCTIRDIRANVVTMQYDVADLELDEHSMDKLLRLVGDRYDRATNCITITADRCPLHMQNTEYCYYLLTVLRAEAEKSETWEQELDRLDHHEFVFEGSSSEEAVDKLRRRQQSSGVTAVTGQDRQQYAAAQANVLNDAESDGSLGRYSSSVLQMLGISDMTHEPTSCHQSSMDQPHTLPDADIAHLPTWQYQESKVVEWINSSWQKYGVEERKAPPF